MSTMSPVGLGNRLARGAAVATVGCLALLLTACGGSSGHGVGGAKGGALLGLARDAAPEAPKGGYDNLQQEQYGTIVENPFTSPRVTPLSTFSAEVNTASYSNVRRFINQGQLPPRDAVFVAELVNYFEYRYPQPTGSDPVSVILDLAPSPWQPDHKLARIGVQARSVPASELPPRNLVFLIDVSGSMAEPTRLPLVQQSLDLLIDRLAARDRVAIVTYAGDTSLRLPPTPGDRKETIRAVVRGLRAGGGTNGGSGIRLAYETARRGFIEGGANRVILCTDGDFNLGQTSDSELVQLIEQERASRVFLTVLGYGMGNYKDQKLKELATHGNGSHAYIDTLDEARKVFVERGGALVCVAKDVKFQVEFNPARVHAYRLIGYENRLLRAEDFKDDTRDAGDIDAGLQVTALYEIVPIGVKMDLPGVDPLKYQAAKKPAAGAADEWLTAKVRYKEPDGDTSKELVRVLPGSAGGEMSEDFRFAAAVAEFGLVLRDSPYKGGATLAGALNRAEGATRYDPHGHRAEFIGLVRRAIALGEARRQN